MKLEAFMSQTYSEMFTVVESGRVLQLIHISAWCFSEVYLCLPHKYSFIHILPVGLSLNIIFTISFLEEILIFSFFSKSFSNFEDSLSE